MRQSGQVKSNVVGGSHALLETAHRAVTESSETAIFLDHLSTIVGKTEVLSQRMQLSSPIALLAQKSALLASMTNSTLLKAREVQEFVAEIAWGLKSLTESQTTSENRDKKESVTVPTAIQK